MSVQNLWPLAFLVLIPVIVLLYILKQKAKEQDFSSNLLWQEIYRNLEAKTPFDKFKNNILMYLQLLLLLLLILALMAPVLKRGGTVKENLVLVVDTSGSMLYAYDGEETRLDYCVEQASTLVDSVDEDAIVTIISCDSEAAIVYQGSDKLTAKARLVALTAKEEAGTLALAATLVNTVIADMDNVQLVCLTDTAFAYEDLVASNEDAALSLINAWSEGENCAIDYVSYAAGDDGVTVLCRVTNYGSSSVSQDLSLYADSQILSVMQITLEAGESDTYYFEDMEIAADGSAVVRVELSAEDALTADNVQKAAIVYDEEKRVLLLSEGNVFLEKALGLNDQVSVYKADSLSVLMQEQDLYDLYVFDGIAPEEEEPAWLSYLPEDAAILFLDQAQDIGGLGGVTLQGTVTNAVLSFAETELTKYLTDFTFGMTEAYTYTLPEWGNSLIRTANGSVVGYYGTNGQRRTAVLGFDIHNSDLALQTEFPIFMSQLTAALLENDTNTAEITNFPTESESAVTPAADGSITDGGELVRSGGRSLRNLILFLVLVLLVVEWLIYTRQVHTAKKRQFLVVRLCVLAAVILAMAGLSITTSQKKAQTIFLVDVSDSMTGNLEEIEDYLKETILAMPEKNSSAIVLFGKDTAVEEFMTDRKTFSQFTTSPVTTATNIENAIETAAMMFDEGVSRHLVLITDGNENEGSMSLSAATLKNNDVELSVIELEDSISEGSEVYIENLTVPSVIRVGDKYNIAVTVVSNVETDARLSLYAGRSLKGQQEVHLTIGTNQFVFEDVAEEETIAQYKAVIEADEDTIAVNNSYATYAQIEATARVLLVEGTTGEAEEFQKLLEAANVEYDCVSPQAVPTTIAQLLNYKAVITLDVYYDDLKTGFAETLESYVKDYAGGYICIGGDNSYALGNYRGTVLEDILPVNMDPDGEKEIPKIAMVMVIDHSGSMSSTAAEDVSVTALTLAKQAAIAGAAQLRETDEVGVLSFDDTYSWVLPLQLAEDQSLISDKISSIAEGGGTSIYPAVQAAYKALLDSDAGIKHIILLTDGQDGYNAYEDLFEKINDAGITLSAVAVGADADFSTLEWMAESCGGRYYVTDISTSVPRIFAQEVYLATNTYLMNGEFYPTVTSNNEILSGIFEDGMPAFLGYIATSAKSTADVLLTSESQDPLLAVWQYGLGRTVAWTSDGTNEWTAEYAVWEEYPQLWANLLNYVIADSSLGEDSLEVAKSGSNAVITYATEDYSRDTKVTAVITDEDGNQQEVELDAVKPGVYEKELELDEVGVYGISLRKYEGGELIASYNTAYANQYSKEYQFADTATSLTAYVEQCGGELITMESDIWSNHTGRVKSRTSLTVPLLILALMLWMLDILLRRLSIDPVAGIRRVSSRFVRCFALPVTAIRRRQAAHREKQEQKREDREQKREDHAAKADGTSKKETNTDIGINSAKAVSGKKQKEKKTKKADETSAQELLDMEELLRKKRDRG